MVSCILFPTVLLFLSNACFSRRFVLASDPHYATTFEKGSEPKPRKADRQRKGRLTSTIDSEYVVEKSLEKPSAARRVRGDSGANDRSLQDVSSCSITNTFSGFNYTDNFSTDLNEISRPDPHGAVGMSRLVAVVRPRLEVRQKDGNLTFREKFRSFFSNFTEAADPNSEFRRPKVVYDKYAGRFVVVVMQLGYVGNDVSRMWLAVSKTETPDTTDDWHKTFIGTDIVINGKNTYAGIPRVAVDNDALYVVASQFLHSDTSFSDVRAWVIKKEVGVGFYAGGPLSFTTSFPYAKVGDSRTTVPAQIHRPSGVDANIGTFFVSVLPFIYGRMRLQILTILDPLTSSPTYSLQQIPLGFTDQLGSIPFAPQLGTTASIDTGDDNQEVLDAVWRDNKLWLVLMYKPRLGPNQGQGTILWVRLGTSSDGSVKYEAQGDIGGEDIASGTHTYFPSLAVNSQGIAAYGYSASSSTTYSGAYVSAGTTDKSYTVRSGLGPFNRTRDGGSNRYGDYSAISVDPTDDSFWAFNIYADTVGSPDSLGDGRWGTVWGRLACTVSDFLF